MAKQSDPLRSDADPTAMPLQEAIDTIVASLEPIQGEESLAVGDAMGRVATRDIVAELAVPPFRASAMDGYACRHSDLAMPAARLQIAGRSLAGHPGPDELSNGSCQYITTGARVPDSADTVVQQEDVTVHDDAAITIDECPRRGENVRAIGSDTPAGTRLVETGQLLRGADLAVCAAHGIDSLRVRRRLRLGILSTGDELVEPNGARGRGQIHDANRILLRALLDQPAVHITDLGIVADEPDALAQRVATASDLDVIVSTGGVSVGEADFVRDVLGAGGTVNLWKIAMKPGRPLAFGHLANGQAWFGLPGNPVSAAVTAMKVLAPALAKLAGHTYVQARPLRARLTTTVQKRPGRIEFQRGVLTTDEALQQSVASVGAQDSHRLQSLQRANCLIELPAESRGASEGDFVTVIPIAV